MDPHPAPLSAAGFRAREGEPDREVLAAHLLAHEGSHAVYREGLGFSYALVRDVRVDAYGMSATVEDVPVRGLLDRPGTWGVSGSWGRVWCDEHAFRIPGIGLAAYFAPEIVDGVLAVCASLPEGHEGDRHVLDIMDVISAYWDSLYEPAPPQTSMPRSSFKEWSRRHP